MKVKLVEGYCYCCSKEVQFSSAESSLRDHYFCGNCGCIPRERALMKVISEVMPDFSQKAVHESSPAERGASIRLRSECEFYTSSHYWPDENYCEPPHLNINLQDQTIADGSFDLVVTQDVFEHLPNPKAASKEIFRTLKPGGFFIQTVPLVNGYRETQQWAKLNEAGELEWIYQPEFHGNPIDCKGGSPVFWHYGFDLAGNIDRWAGFKTIIISSQIERFGIEGRLCEVLVSQRPSHDTLQSPTSHD